MISAVLIAIWVAEYKVWYANYGEFSQPVPHSACIHTNLTCYPSSPGWALPAGIVLGLLGVLAAALLYSPRARRPLPGLLERS